jgi:hypothetical protein
MIQLVLAQKGDTVSVHKNWLVSDFRFPTIRWLVTSNLHKQRESNNEPTELWQSLLFPGGEQFFPSVSVVLFFSFPS